VGVAYWAYWAYCAVAAVAVGVAVAVAVAVAVGLAVAVAVGLAVAVAVGLAVAVAVGLAVIPARCCLARAAEENNSTSTALTVNRSTILFTRHLLKSQRAFKGTFLSPPSTFYGLCVLSQVIPKKK
jgi:hypothetical protein